MIRAIWSLLREVPTTIRLSIDANAAWHSLRPGCGTHWYDMCTMPYEFETRPARTARSGCLSDRSPLRSPILLLSS